MATNTKGLLGIVAVVAVIAIVAVIYFGLFAKRGPITDVDSAGLREAVSQGATLIDVRTPEEYSEGHIASAILMPDYDSAALMKDLPRDTEYVVYCRTGNRSSRVVKWMADNGFTNIKHLNKGIVSWDGELVQGAEPGEADFGTGGSEVTPTGDVGEIDIMKSTDGRMVLVEFATRT